MSSVLIERTSKGVSFGIWNPNKSDDLLMSSEYVEGGGSAVAQRLIAVAFTHMDSRAVCEDLFEQLLVEFPEYEEQINEVRAQVEADDSLFEAGKVSQLSLLLSQAISSVLM